MKLYVLKPIGFDGDSGALPKGSPWQPWYDKAFAFVVRAKDDDGARVLAADQCGDEGHGVWLDEKLTSCEELTEEGEVEVVCRDFASA